MLVDRSHGERAVPDARAWEGGRGARRCSARAWARVAHGVQGWGGSHWEVRLGGARRDDHRCRVGSPVGTESDMQLEVAEVGAGAAASPAAARMCTPAGVRVGPRDDPLRAVWL